MANSRLKINETELKSNSVVMKFREFEIAIENEAILEEFSTTCDFNAFMLAAFGYLFVNRIREKFFNRRRRGALFFSFDRGSRIVFLKSIFAFLLLSNGSQRSPIKVEPRVEMLNLKIPRTSTMNDNNVKRCAFHILQIEANYVKSNTVCKYGRRLRRRLTPYYVPGGRVVFVENEIHERTHRKSENSDTGNENEDLKDCETFVSSVGLFKSKSLENINSSSHNFNFTHDFLIELESRKNPVETSDVELVSSKMKCLNV